MAGRVTDLLVPSSVMLAVFEIQLGGAASVPACSNPKPAVSADGWLIRTDERMMGGFPTYGVDTGRHGAWAS